MQALKSFVDGQGRRLKPGDTLPSDYDTQTLKHYARHGMVGEPAPSSKPLKSNRATRMEKMRPAETKPVGPEEGQSLQPTDTSKPAEPAEPAQADLESTETQIV